MWCYYKERYINQYEIECTNKPLYLISTDFQQGCQDSSIGKGMYFQQMVLEQLGKHRKWTSSYVIVHTKFNSR